MNEKRILIIDNNSGDIEEASSILSGEGYKYAGNGLHDSRRPS